MRCDELPANYFKKRVYKEYEFGNNIVEDLASRQHYLKWLIDKSIPFDKNTKIFELGCGNGILLKYLQSSGYKFCSGVDVSPSQVMASQKQGIVVEQADLIDSLKSKKSKSIDVIIAFDVIEHLSKNELLDLADEVFRVLSENGRWIIHCPNGDSPFFSVVRYGDWTHEQVFTDTSLRQLARVVGFGKVQSFEDKIIVHGAISLIRSLLWKCCKKLIQFIYLIETGNSGNGVYTRNILSVIFKTKTDK